MTRHYVTACHAHQLPVLLGSMRRHCRPFVLHVLAWDWDPDTACDCDPMNRTGGDHAPSCPDYTPDCTSYEFIGGHQPGCPARALAAIVNITSRDEFLERHPRYRALPGPPRRTVDEVCTARWRFLADLVEFNGAPATLIDGDLWFWSDPSAVFTEIGAAPMAVTAHNIPGAADGLPGVTLETHRRYGAYNSGFTHFADPAPARAMADRTFAWSRTEVRHLPDGPDFGDQGSLERVAFAYGAHVVQHPGVNVGPWNVHAKTLRQTHDGAVFYGGRPLVAYHYSSFRPGPGGQMADPHYAVTAEQGRILYEPYEAAILTAALAAARSRAG